MEARLSRRRTPSTKGRGIHPALLLSLALFSILAPRMAAAQAGSDTLKLVWTAPGDDGLAGKADHFEVRLSTSPITDSNWDSAWLIGSTPAPLPSGQRQSLIVRGLSRGTTYYFALKSIDDVGNTSALSNVVRYDWILDTAPPAAPAGVTVVVENTTDARVRWSANSEADFSSYTVYRRITSGGAFQAISPSVLTATQFLDDAIPAGTAQVWYQITARDVTGNESARSAMVSLSFGGPVATATFELKPVYPNPSRVISSVSIPVNVPAAGGGAELFIMDSGGRRIRNLSLTGLTGGPQTLTWDGRNDAGGTVAPGVYTAWLITSGQRLSAKMVRQP
jgi:hypothetical protein